MESYFKHIIDYSFSFEKIKDISWMHIVEDHVHIGIGYGHDTDTLLFLECLGFIDKNR